MEHLSNEDTLCSPNHIELCSNLPLHKETSIYRTAIWVPKVSSIERFYYTCLPKYSHTSTHTSTHYTSVQYSTPHHTGEEMDVYMITHLHTVLPCPEWHPLSGASVECANHLKNT